MSPVRSVTAYAPRPYPKAFAAPPPGFDLADFFRILSARRTLIIRVTIATVILAVLVAFSLPTVYSSSAVVLLDTRKNNVTDASAVLSQLQSDPATLQDQIQILTSRELAQKVINSLKLYDDPEFNGTLAPPGLAGVFDPRNWDGPAPFDAGGSNDRIMESFLRHVSAEANGLSSASTVTVTSRDPAKAARIANALAQAYVDDQVVRRHQAGSETTAWLESRANALSDQLQTQNQDIQRFKAQNGLADAGPGTSLVDQQMLGINSQIVEAQSQLDQKLADQQRMQQPGTDPSSASQVLSSSVVAGLRAQQADLARQYADLDSKYGDSYPKKQELQAQRQQIDQKLAQEIGRIAASADNDVAAARGHLASLKGSLQRTEQLAVNQNMARSQLQGLESNATSTRNIYESFLQRLHNAQDQDAALTPDSRIISAATVPLAPSSPKRKLVVGAALPLGALLGVLAALLLERFGHLLPVRVNGARRASLMPPAAFEAARAPRWNGPPILGEIANTASLSAADYVIDWPASRFAQASAALVRQLESQDGEASVVALTAPEPGDSKSVIAVSLARAAARMGKKTVIIDCDPARRTAAAMQAPTSAGLYEVLTGAVPLNQALAKDPRGQAFLLTLNQRPASASNMFASPQMARLVEILRDGCDFVVLDCGPTLAGPDAALIAAQADVTVLVSRREKFRGRSVANATRILEEAQAAPVGLVLAS